MKTFIGTAETRLYPFIYTNEDTYNSHVRLISNINTYTDYSKIHMINNPENGLLGHPSIVSTTLGVHVLHAVRDSELLEIEFNIMPIEQTLEEHQLTKPVVAILQYDDIENYALSITLTLEQYAKLLPILPKAVSQLDILNGLNLDNETLTNYIFNIATTN